MTESEDKSTREKPSPDIEDRIMEAKRSLGMDSIYSGFVRKFSSSDGYRDEFGFGSNSSLVTLRYLYFAVKLGSLYLVKSISSLRIKK
jgi:hypothetical protein